MKKILFIFACCVAIGLTIFSCSEHDENLDIIEKIDNNKQKTPLNKESSNFKTDVISILKEQKKQTKGGENIKFTKEQTDYLKKQSLKMFNSHGFRPSEFREFLDEGDDRIILMATMFVGILESESTNFSLPRVKSGDESGGADDGTCWDIAQVVYCAQKALISAVGADVIQSWFTGYRCLTKTIIKDILKNAFKKFPIVAVATAMLDFSDCMGLFPWQD